jgi:hypothetical protein
MDKRRRKKHQSHKRGLALVDEHRGYLTRTPGGAATVANLDQHIANETTAITDQESNDSEQRSASSVLRKLRRAFQHAIKHIAAVSAVVTPGSGTEAPFDPTHPTNDDELIGRIEFLHAEVAANQDAFTKAGIQPGMLDTLAGQVADFNKAKGALTNRQHAEAAQRFDRAFDLANQDFAIIEGILATSADAPTGALEALRATTRIGPRIPPDDSTTQKPQQGTTSTPAPANPVTSSTSLTSSSSSTGAETTDAPAAAAAPDPQNVA